MSSVMIDHLKANADCIQIKDGINFYNNASIINYQTQFYLEKINFLYKDSYLKYYLVDKIHYRNIRDHTCVNYKDPALFLPFEKEITPFSFSPSERRVFHSSSFSSIKPFNV
jgi:hypothetical protein